jgi:hypothetical protein
MNDPEILARLELVEFAITILLRTKDGLAADVEKPLQDVVQAWRQGPFPDLPEDLGVLGKLRQLRDTQKQMDENQVSASGHSSDH